MLEQAISGLWILYVMMGICAVGVASRLWLAGIYSGLSNDVQYAKEPKKKLIKQIKERYETCYRLREGVNNVDAFLIKNLYGYRFFGITLGGIQKISGQAMFLCLLIGGLAAGYAYTSGMPLETIGIYSACAIGMATLLIYINCIFDVQGRQVILEAGIMDYLQNYFSAILDKKKERVEKTGLAKSTQAEEMPKEWEEKEEKNQRESFQKEKLQKDGYQREGYLKDNYQKEEPQKEGKERRFASPKLKSVEENSLSSSSKKERILGKKAAVFHKKEETKPEEENTSAKEQAERLLSELRKNPRRGKEASPDLQAELENLRTSLNQIATSLEKGRNGENRQLAEEEMRIVEEILGEFLT